jgi:hypothetical protein
MDTYHATVLNLHQPTGNLQELLETRAWEAREILYALDRIPRALAAYQDRARVPSWRPSATRTSRNRCMGS